MRIWSKIKKGLTPPVFEDEDKTRVAFLLSVTVLTLFLIAVVRMILASWTLPEYQAILMRTNLGLIGALVLVFAIMRSGSVRLACILFTLYQWTTIAWLTFHYGGLNLSIFSFFIFVILSSGLFLGRWWAVSYTAISIAYGILLSYFEKRGTIEPLLETPGGVLYFMIPSFITTAVLVFLYDRDISNSFMRIRRDAAQLEETNARLTREISIRQRLENQLVHAQKMEAVGTLAGGIAHDFNNILSGIIGFAELALSGAQKGTSLHQDLTEVYIAGKRARDLVSQLLTFSRQTNQDLKPVQVRPIVHEVLKLLRASLPSTVEIVQNLESNAAVNGDPVQIQQALMNLCTNAGYAMREEGGRLGVDLEEVFLGSKEAARFTELAPGRYLKMTVSDTGVGIDPEILGRVFEPFFTTKSKGEGTGLGLSVVHGIVKSHQGAIRISSEPGEGTICTVYLPVVDTEFVQELVDEEDIPTGTERILFIDDEQFIVDMAGRMLNSLGYKVTAATGSLEALEIFEKHSTEFDLVMTDMTMPHMRGDALAGKLLAIKPDVRVIVCTGFNLDMPDDKARKLGIRAILKKPFLRRDLALKIREVLDNGN